MVKVYFIRHAQSTWNAYGDLSKDTPITDKGKEQAKQVSGFVHTVICSNLLRAKETLAHSNLKYNDVIYTDLCREIKGGTPCDYLHHEDVNYHESNNDLVTRLAELKEIINELTKDDPNKIIGIISHHCFIHYVTGVSTFNCQVFEHHL